MSENEQNNYTNFFIQRQEQFLIDFIRRCIASESKEAIHLKNIQDIKSQYEESQKQVAIQNDMMQQATRSIEELTNKNHKLEIQINQLQNNINNLQTNNNESNKKIRQSDEENNNLKARNDSLQKEVQRLNQEINYLVKEQKEKESKTINKKKKEEPVDTVISSEENIF